MNALQLPPPPIRAGAVCLNAVASRGGKYAAICHCCGRKSRPVAPLRDAEPDLFLLARGWSTAPFPSDFVHKDGSRGSQFTCPSCNKQLHRGEWVVTRAYLREASA